MFFRRLSASRAVEVGSRDGLKTTILFLKSYGAVLTSRKPSTGHVSNTDFGFEGFTIREVRFTCLLKRTEVHSPKSGFPPNLLTSGLSPAALA